MSGRRGHPVHVLIGALAAGCGSHGALSADGGSGPGTTASQTLTWSEAGKAQADILFMIDSGGSEDTAHANLKANFANFMDVLKALPGGLPDLHVAIITADMGAGDGTSIAGCSVNGDDGVFHYQASGPCTMTGLDANATFVADTGGTNPVTNFGTQDITYVLECIAEVGSAGCGFRQQLRSVARALGADGAAPPPQNAGFLRPDALLVIVMLTDADDCSAPPGSPLFNPISSSLNSKYGPTQHFLCNEWGHLCVPPGGGAPVPPSRFAPNNSVTDTIVYTPATATMSNCQSFEQSPVMTPVGALSDGIKALKADPANQILVTALVGMTEGPDSEGYTVSWRTPPTPDTGPWPGVDHACGDDAAGAPVGFADPAVRIEQFVHAFGTNGLVDNFCQANYGPSLTSIATKLVQMTAPPCFTAQVAFKPGAAQRDCAVTESAPDPSNPAHVITTNIPACDSIGTVPCWQLGPATAQCQGGSLSILHGSGAPPDGATVSATCAVCITGQPDPSRGCP